MSRVWKTTIQYRQSKLSKGWHALWKCRCTGSFTTAKSQNLFANSNARQTPTHGETAVTMLLIFRSCASCSLKWNKQTKNSCYMSPKGLRSVADLTRLSSRPALDNKGRLAGPEVRGSIQHSRHSYGEGAGPAFYITQWLPLRTFSTRSHQILRPSRTWRDFISPSIHRYFRTRSKVLRERDDD